MAPDSRGLIDVIAGKLTLNDAIWTDRLTNLAFLPSGATPKLLHTNEILASATMKKLFEHLRSIYDYVVVDLPPLAPVVDVRSTAGIIDSYMYVVEWGRTKIDVVEHNLAMAPGIYDRLLGVVLNKADTNILGRYEGYHGNYYYNKYYARYGVYGVIGVPLKGSAHASFFVVRLLIFSLGSLAVAWALFSFSNILATVRGCEYRKAH